MQEGIILFDADGLDFCMFTPFQGAGLFYLTILT